MVCGVCEGYLQNACEGGRGGGDDEGFRADKGQTSAKLTSGVLNELGNFFLVEAVSATLLFNSSSSSSTKVPSTTLSR